MSEVVARFYDVHEAELAAAMLRSASIDAQIADRTLIGVDPLMLNAVGGLRVMVPSAEAEDARAILNRAQAGEFALDDADDPPPRPAGGWLVPGVVLGWLLAPEMAMAVLALRRPFSWVRLAGLVMVALAALLWFAMTLASSFL